jgi:uncharacterized repeat protein (TIGR03843 family)
VSPTVIEILETGSIEIEARFANSSNTTLLVRVRLEGEELSAVYKPEGGERPLWDFPEGLWRREVAAYRLSEFLELDLVPETIERVDAPLGPGSLQRYVDDDPEHHYFTLRELPTLRERFVAIAAFDVVANNSDRKSGHVLLAGSELWCIDHGLCFHVHDKLRTVIWDFAGEPLDEALLEHFEALVQSPPAELTALLSDQELEALRRRARALVDEGGLPFPEEDGPYPPYPWPLI